MKTLLVLRHGKSPHPEGVGDHERPLLPGVDEQIARLARRLAEERLTPEVVLTSDALRALATAAAYAQAVRCAEPVALPELYEPGDPEDVLEAVRHWGQSSRVVLVVGHNPGLEELCNRLTKRPLLGHLGTGALAAFAADIKAWTEMGLGSAALMGVWPSH